MGLRGEPTGAPERWVADVAATAKCDLVATARTIVEVHPDGSVGGDEEDEDDDEAAQ